MSPLDLNSFFKKCHSLKVLLIGDIMIDRYVWGQVERISPEAPVPVVHVEREERSLGGMGNVLKNLAPYGVEILPVMVLGVEPDAEFIRNELARYKIRNPIIFEDPERQIPVKTRILASSQQLARIDRESTHPISNFLEIKILEKISELLPTVHVLLLSDYGKGLLTPNLLKEIIRSSREKKCPVLVDPKGQNYEVYRDCTLITPNRKEAEGASGIIIKTESDLLAAAKIIQKKTQAEAVLITRGKDGMTLYEKSGSFFHIPTQAKEVFDVTGAGDTVLAFMGMGLAAGGSLLEAAELANRAAGIVVGKIGAVEVMPEELQNSFSNPQSTAAKITPLEKLLPKITQHKKQGKKIVFTNGCFDLLHPGHISILEGAKAKGDILVVALNSDISVEKIKGIGRPILPLSDRTRMMAALACVDYVTSFDETTPARIIEELKPDILVKGGDYPLENIVGRDTVVSNGGRVDTIPFENPHSTTALIQKIQSLKDPM